MVNTIRNIFNMTTMHYNSLFAAISSAMALTTRLALPTRAFSPRGRLSFLVVAPPFRLSSSAFFSNSHSDANVSHTTKRMRVESEQEMSRLLERLNTVTAASTALPQLCTTRDQVAAYLNEHDIDSILFDCDGVVYRSPDPAPGARACIQSLALHQNKRVFFVTNNAASNRAQLRDKLASILDMDHHKNDSDNDDSKAVLTQDVMVPSSFSAAQYLKQQLLPSGTSSKNSETDATTTGRLFVIGSQGLADELRQAGFTIVGGAGSDNSNEKTSMSRDELANYDFDTELHPIDAVVVGHDTNLHFRKLAMAQVLLQKNPNALLVATNTDAFDLVGAHGYEIPGNGGAVKYLEWTSRRTAINCGKPSPILASILHDLYGLDTSRALFVGDRLDTDIQFGIDTGMHTALVLTGVTTGHQMADILIQQQQQQDESTKDSNYAIPSIILPHIGLLA